MSLFRQRYSDYWVATVYASAASRTGQLARGMFTGHKIIFARAGLPALLLIFLGLTSASSFEPWMLRSQYFDEMLDS